MLHAVSSVVAASTFVLACAPLAAQVSGVVVDAATQTPIAGALVSVQATPLRTTTSDTGTFTLPATGAGIHVVAAHKGYYNGGIFANAPATGVVLALERVVVGDDHGYQLMDPQTCGTCHPDQYAQWYGSPMSKAGTNSWVHDCFDGNGTAGGAGGFVYTRDSVHAAGNPASECAACHQPEPWIKTPFRAMEAPGGYSTGALHGVSCDVCHKIADVDERKLNFPGIFAGAVTFNRPDSPLTLHQVEYGVLGDTDFHAPGLMRPSYQPQLVAEVCAVCHQDKNDPDGDLDFEEPDGVVSEPTYEEWRASAYGDPSSPLHRTCVDCHMPPSGATYVSTFLPIPRDPDTIRSHRIEGTTPAYLENAVDLDLQAKQDGPLLQVHVDVHNRHTGHHVPTGVTIRNVVLLVEAWRVADASRLPLVSGPRLHALAGIGAPEQGYYAGLPGRLYAKINHDALGNSPTFYTDATGLVADTRIPALATDASTYVFRTQPGDEVTVRARLIYRRSWRALVDAKQWTTDGHGNPLADIAPPYYGHLMEEASWSSPGPGPVVALGSGCEGLAAGWQGLPQTGAPFGATLSGAAAAVPALFWLGFDDTNWNGVPLPFDLGPLGAPTCSVLASVDVPYPASTDAIGAAAVPLVFAPPWPIGVRVFGQWAALSANPFGLALSDALSITFQR